MAERTARILRYEVPVDDQWHTLRLPGPIVHVATRRADVVELWAHAIGEEYDVDLKVVGTGHQHPLENFNVAHIGTAIVPGGQLVWHLLQRGQRRLVTRVEVS